MTFKHKLSVRLALLKDALARMWPPALAFLLPSSVKSSIPSIS